jgi:hypothetical protein
MLKPIPIGKEIVFNFSVSEAIIFWPHFPIQNPLSKAFCGKS